MPHTNPPDETLRRILLEARTIAIVGASSNPDRPSHGIMKQLLAAGYDVIPVNPRESAVLGRAAVATLAAIGRPVDIVDVFRKADDTLPIASDAIAIDAKVLWLQSGITNEETATRAKIAGLTVVMDRCIGATHRALHIPRR